MPKDLEMIAPTPRKPIKKLDQLEPKQLERFNKLALSEPYSVVEKVDGFALRLFLHKGQLMFETSHSDGVVDSRDFIFPEIAEQIERSSCLPGLFNNSLKLVGELVWNYGLDADGTFAPVCARYSPSSSTTGSYFVVFSILRAVNSELVELPGSDYSKAMAKILDAARWARGEALEYVDGKALSYNIPIADGEIPSYALASAVDQCPSHLSKRASQIEGLVVNFQNGEQYGVFSSNYRDAKKALYARYNEVEALIKGFKKQVYGNTTRFAITKAGSHLTSSAAEAYAELEPIAASQIRSAISAISSDPAMPASCARFQAELLKRKLAKLESSNAAEYINGI